VGEGGAVVAPAAIASAVEDALAPLGICIAALPIVPSRLWAAAAAGLKRYDNARK
jgi:carbon-monoxide dehydrogenase large subunit